MKKKVKNTFIGLFVFLAAAFGVKIYSSFQTSDIPFEPAYLSYLQESCFDDVQQTDEDGRTALHRAMIEEEDAKWILFLLKQGANVNARDKEGNTPLHYIYKYQSGDWDEAGRMSAVMKLLLGAGANVNAKNNRRQTPLLTILNLGEAPFNDRYLAVKILIEAGADVNVKEKSNGIYPLYFAPYFGGGVVELLVSSGASLRIENNFSENPLFIPCSLGDSRSALFLMQNGASLHSIDSRGKTPLMVVASAKRKSPVHLAKLLISKGAKINTRDKSGKTALIYAASFGNVSMVYTLLQAGADVNIKDKEGKTALDHAKEAGHKGVVYYLEKAL